MTPPTKLKKAVDALRKVAAKLPNAVETSPFGYISYKVKDKGFLGIKWDKSSILVSVKLPKSGHDALDLPFAEPTHGGLGKHGWVSFRFAEGDDMPLPLLKQWIEESYRAVAGKKPAA